MDLEQKIARMRVQKLGDEILARCDIVGQMFRALVEPRAFALRDFPESRVLGIHPDFVENTGAQAFADGMDDQGFAAERHQVFLLQPLTAHARRYHRH
jgi:hypothetical protein